MPRTMRHEEVSEVLVDYARGDLDAATKASVDEHLSGCRICAAELKAVSVLHLEQAPLSDAERSRLHRAVAEQVGPSPARQSPLRRARWAARVAPALGAAALVALGVVGALGLITGEGGDELGGRSGAEDGGALTGVGDGGGDQGAASKHRRARGADKDGAQAEGVEESSEAGDPEAASIAGALEPTFDPTTAPLTERDLSALARKTGYDAFDSSGAPNRMANREVLLVEQLSRMAPKAVRGQVRSCARSVTSRGQEQLFATFGTLTEVDDRPSLVLGFIWPGPPQDRTGYMLWAWPRGSCEEPLAYSASGDNP